LSESVDIATRLYRSARADYMEVLLTQRDALEAQMELVELEQQQIAALVRMYQLLGGGTEDPCRKPGDRLSGAGCKFEKGFTALQRRRSVQYS
jgi:hypothetical protein